MFTICDNGDNREMKKEEIAEFLAHREAANAQREAAEAEQAAKLAAKESAKAKLSALGLTADEVAALLA